jgi:sialidase-1
MQTLSIIAALIFSVIVYTLQAQFGSEFALIAETRWVLALLAGLLIGNALLSAVPRSGQLVRTGLQRILRPTLARVLFALWSIAAALALGVVGAFIVLLLLDYFTGITTLALALIAGSVGALVIVLVSDALVWKRAPHGMLLAPILLLITFVVGIRLVTYEPTWGATSHTTVYARGDQSGRAYRIPSLLMLPDRTLLAFSESRMNAFLDWGDIDIVARRSTDGGTTWGPIETIADAGGRTAGNACPVFDAQADVLFLPYTIDNKTVMLRTSSDGGVTWSDERDLTAEFGLGAEWNPRRFDYQYGTGPGVGIQLGSGRLVVPAYCFSGEAHVIFSDDHGITWQAGSTIGPGGEPQVAELDDGSLLMSSRNDAGGYRYFGISRDGGETWSDWGQNEEVPDVGCMASLISTGSDLYYASPSADSRNGLVVRRSRDASRSWERVETVYTGPSAYSQLLVLDRELLVLFEQGKFDYRESIQLARIPLN